MNPHDHNDHGHDDHGHSNASAAGHGHHHHDHGPPPEGYGGRFAAGIALNLGFVFIEATYGYLAGSLALIADAGHNFSDVLSLGLAWGAAGLAGSKPSPRWTYGYRRATILASLLSAGMLLLAMGGIAWEAIGRFSEPAPLNGMTMIVVAGIGVVINTATALMFASGRHGDLNIRAAFLHMAVARSGHQPHHRGRDCLGHLGSVARIARTGNRCRSAQHRSGRSFSLAQRTAGCDADPRSAYLGDEHDGKRADRAPRDAGRQRRPFSA